MIEPIAARREALLSKVGETLAETLYRTLLEMIVFGRFEQNPRLMPGEIAVLFNVSQTPVREALARLASDGYLEAIPRRGFHIRKPTAGMVLETWQVRQGLELNAGELLISRLKTGDLDGAAIDRIRKVQDKVEASFAAEDSRAHTELNSEFHRLIVSLSGNKLLLSIYESAQNQALRAWVKRGSGRWTGRGDKETGEHRAIIAAIVKMDVEAYSRAVRQHLGRSMSDAMSDIDAARATQPVTDVFGDFR